MFVEQVIEAQTKLGLVESSVCTNRVIEVGIRLVERVNGCLVVIGTVVRIKCADTFVEHTEIPALALIGDALGLSVGGCVRDPQTGGRGDDNRCTCAVRRSAIDAQIADIRCATDRCVEIDAKAMGDIDVALRLESLRDGAGLEKVDGLARGVEGGRVAVLEADVVEIRIEGDAFELQNRACLIGSVALLFRQSLDRSAVRALVVVEDFAWRNDAAGGNLTIDWTSCS